MNRLPYSQLAIFVAIARHNSIRAAACSLSMSAPSVSQALKQLEARLGVPLLLRSTRQMELTEAGRTLLNQAEPALSQLADAFAEAGAQSQVPTGRVRLTLPRFVYQLYLKRLFAEFCRQYPQIELDLSVDDRAVDLIEQGFDLGIRMGDRISEGMVARRLGPPMTEALFASPAYLAQYGQPQTLTELNQHRLIQYRFMASNQTAPLTLLHQGEAVRVELPHAMVVNDTDLMVDAALEGLGIGRFLSPAVQPLFDSGKLVPVLENYWYHYPGLHLYFPQGAQKALRVRVLIDYLTARPFTLRETTP
ncbi:LysR family transcriptional regulator [Ferrimonas balearica]|uniref:LysR family transcriptional regulator n=1 Tax=Ferrimonas balearica TaxID=44012 RepID=UPI001F3D516B|nr:LysR family transcriptional regulator [Ferrimonas balearica]MBY6093300.1 LysR family transcriptional regulator [Ferrimonas balearica]